MKNKILLILLMLSVLFIASCELSTTTDEPVEKIYNLRFFDTLTEEMVNYQYKQETLTYYELPIFEKEGYLFKGFSKKIGGTLLGNDDIVNLNEDLQLYLNWEEIITNKFLVDEIGRVEINVYNPITSKKEYVQGTVSISGKNYSLEEANAKIRLRGNSSLSAPKKSYKIKFNEKQNVFGFGKDKEWALIANYYDPSLVRNFYAYKLAQILGMEYAVECKYVELYLNDEYQGLYLFVETVKTGSNRVDIETDEDVVDLPFLLELDQKMISEGDPDSNGVKDVDYFELNLNQTAHKMYPIGTKYPDAFNEITEEQYESIKQRVYDAFNSVENGTYENHFDVDSVINFYLIQELMMNIDLDHSSVFFYQPLGGKIHMGPVWDFDISAGNCNYVYNYSPNTTMAKVNGGSYLFNKMMTYDSFKSAFAARLRSIATLIGTDFYDSFEANYETLAPYMAKDLKKWDNLDKEYWPKPDYLIGLTHEEQMIYFRDYIVEHLAYLLRIYK